VTDSRANRWSCGPPVSLARLWQQRGGRADAQALLVLVYNWFIEGSDTADLQEAKTLLEELSP
jgi:predicted ATPase